MAKSLRCKKEKRLRAIRREMELPFYDKREAAKMSALEAALAAPKLPVRVTGGSSSSMDVITAAAPPSSITDGGDVEMADNNQKSKVLKPMGRKMKKKVKIANRKRGKGKMRKNV